MPLDRSSAPALSGAMSNPNLAGALEAGTLGEAVRRLAARHPERIAARTIDDGASVRGAFHVGGRFETEAGGWDPVFDRGSASLAVMMAPDLLLYLEKGANYPASDDICTSEGFGGGQGRIRIGTLSVPTNLPMVRIDIPF